MTLMSKSKDYPMKCTDVLIRARNASGMGKNEKIACIILDLHDKDRI